MAKVFKGLVVQPVVRQVRCPIASGPDLVEVLLGRRRGCAHVQKQQREQREVKLMRLPGAQQLLLVAKHATGAVEHVQQYPTVTSTAATTMLASGSADSRARSLPLCPLLATAKLQKRWTRTRATPRTRTRT